jgi:DNA modification methylase
VAAKNLGRRFAGVDQSPLAVEIARGRLAKGRLGKGAVSLTSRRRQDP